MRKIVCSNCAKDWGIQHSCAFTTYSQPTVIYEPEPFKLNPEVLPTLQIIIEKAESLKYSITAASDSIGPLWETEQICELLYKLEKDLENK
jgi:hypothetical protein